MVRPRFPCFGRRDYDVITPKCLLLLLREESIPTLFPESDLSSWLLVSWGCLCLMPPHFRISSSDEKWSTWNGRKERVNDRECYIYCLFITEGRNFAHGSPYANSSLRCGKPSILERENAGRFIFFEKQIARDAITLYKRRIGLLRSL